LSKQTKIIEEKEHEIPTIRKFFNEILDDKRIIIFKNRINGQMTAAKPKKPTSMPIVIPKQISDKGLASTLEDWCYYHIAIPKEVIEELKEQDG
jgi:hypothetical protein